MTDDALALYTKAAELAPANPQYHEYIGEYLHNLKRPDEAKTAWSKIAAGPNKNPKNLARLAEVLAGFGYLKEAIAPLTEAVALEADNFDYHLKLADYLHRLERYDDAETELVAARQLAEKEEEKDAVLDARVKNDLAANRIARRIETLQTEIDRDPKPTAEKWDMLARYLEADGKLPEAVRAAEKAIQIDPRSIQAWTLTARLRESAGNLADAGDALRRLAEIDRRNRTEHLTGIARLESRLGRIDAALKAGRDLLAAAPGNPEHYEFFAQLCFQLGKADEGLDALRRAVRTNPNDARNVLSLAETLAGQYQTEEAIEMYWRAFDRADDLDKKIDIVRRLAELYVQRNQFDRLLTRLEHTDRGDRPPVEAGGVRERDVALCVAQALVTSGDMGARCSELERLLAANNRDPQLLKQLTRLAEEEGDIESASRYQKLLTDMAPNDEELSHLGDLYARSGEIDEAQAVWSKLATGKSGTSRVYHAIDNLLSHQKPQPVVEITEAILRKDPTDWEALYREGVALVRLGKPELAERRFESILALTIADDEKSAQAKARARHPRTPAAAISREVATPLEDRIGMTYAIRRACNLDALPRPIAWVPDDFGQARMAALGWLLSLEPKDNPANASRLAAIRAAAEKSPADVRALWDWFYACQLRFDNAALFEAARKLSRAATADPTRALGLSSCHGGQAASPGPGTLFHPAGQRSRPADRGSCPGRNSAAKHRARSYAGLLSIAQARRPDLAGAMVLINISDELKRAKRLDQEERFYREVVTGASQIGPVVGAFVLAARRGDAAGLDSAL